ncbi:MAG: orotate phosphoribosyltransferase, partial [Pyrinomonadaceae bacterium]
LSSGRHSAQYLQCALALQRPADAAWFGDALARQFADEQIEAVASPAIGGLIIGYEVARHLDLPFFWTERENGNMTVRRGFWLSPGRRVLVIEDVVTTGGSTREAIEAVYQAGGRVIAAGSIIDRSNGAADVGVPRISLASLEVPSYEPADCPMCARGEVAVKPGSRQA